MPRGRFDPARSLKLIREIVANSRIYLPLSRIFPPEKYSEGGEEIGHLGKGPRNAPRAWNAPAVFTVRSVSQHFADRESARSFQREVSSVLQLRDFSNGGFDSRPVRSSSLLARSVQLYTVRLRAFPKGIAIQYR